MDSGGGSYISLSCFFLATCLLSQWRGASTADRPRRNRSRASPPESPKLASHFWDPLHVHWCVKVRSDPRELHASHTLGRSTCSTKKEVAAWLHNTTAFLEMKGGRRVYMKKIIDTQQAIQRIVWPYQNNRTSIAGGSRALFLGAQTNRGLQQGCVVKRTFQERYQEVLTKVHALAAGCSKELPYLGIYVTQLSEGQGLNKHRDYRNHEEYLNYTINFGQYEGGHLEMLRNEEWQSCAVPLVWTEFTADIIEHRVREVTRGERFSVTLFTPSHLERLSDRDWMNLESKGFPVHLYAGRASAVSKAQPEGLILEVESSEATVCEQAQIETVDTSVLALETGPGRVDKMDEALSQLTDQIPKPHAVPPGSSGCSLQQLALLTREFNSAMGLPEGTSTKSQRQRSVCKARGCGCLAAKHTALHEAGRRAGRDMQECAVG